MKRWLGFLPGITLLAAVGCGGKFIEQSIAVYVKAHHAVFPNIEYVLWAIVIGVVVANVFGGFKWFDIFRPGIDDTYELFLKVGIILLGSRFVLADILGLGGISLAMVAIELLLAVVIMMWLGKKFGLAPKLITLLAVGSSICGVSAIIATKGAIDADDEDTSTAMAVILSTGAIFLFAFPWIGHLLSLGQHPYGLWAGLAVDNTAEAIAAGALYGDAAGKIAVLAKTARNATIGFVVLAFALQYARAGLANKVENKARFLWEKFPKFVLGFLVVSILASLHFFGRGELKSLANLSRWAFLFTFAAVGLRVNIRELAKQSWRPFVVGLVGEVAVAAVTLVLLIAANAIKPF
jgi:uncharacterized integral membrane protein (TIGR00698 family)